MKTKTLSIRTPEGRKLLAFCAFALTFSCVVLMLTFDVNLDSVIPDENRMSQLRREEKKALTAWKQLEAKHQILLEQEKKYKELLNSGWTEEKNGSPEVEIPKILHSLARKNDLELSGVSAVRRTRINNDLTFLEIDANTVAPLSSLTGFWQDIQQQKPAMVWRKIDLRPETVQNSDRVIFNGTMRLLFLGENFTDGGAK